MKSSIHLNLAEKIYFYKREYLSNKQQWINEVCSKLRDRIEYLNNLIRDKLNVYLNHGPKYTKLSLPSTPFVGNYFYYPNGEFKHPDDINPLIEYDSNYQLYVMAHNIDL
ncbi:unnamed protein product [Rotaria sp. Silwood2]|nr:unnamed protein product [Rotaria sp. Silwood2]